MKTHNQNIERIPRTNNRKHSEEFFAKISKNNKKVFEFIKKYYQKYHQTPSYKIIGEKFGWTREGVRVHMKTMERLGWIRKIENKSWHNWEIIV